MDTTQFPIPLISTIILALKKCTANCQMKVPWPLLSANFSWCCNLHLLLLHHLPSQPLFFNLKITFQTSPNFCIICMLPHCNFHKCSRNSTKILLHIANSESSMTHQTHRKPTQHDLLSTQKRFYVNNVHEHICFLSRCNQDKDVTRIRMQWG